MRKHEDEENECIGTAKRHRTDYQKNFSEISVAARKLNAPLKIKNVNKKIQLIKASNEKKGHERSDTRKQVFAYYQYSTMTIILMAAFTKQFSHRIQRTTVNEERK